MTTTGTNGPRVFASHTSTDKWEPDVDVGDNGLMHVLCLEGRQHMAQEKHQMRYRGRHQHPLWW